MFYSHSYEDPDTGQLVDVVVDDGDEYRNAIPMCQDSCRVERVA